MGSWKMRLRRRVTVGVCEVGVGEGGRQSRWRLGVRTIFQTEPTRRKARLWGSESHRGGQKQRPAKGLAGRWGGDPVSDAEGPQFLARLRGP